MILIEANLPIIISEHVAFFLSIYTPTIVTNVLSLRERERMKRQKHNISKQKSNW